MSSGDQFIAVQSVVKNALHRASISDVDRVSRMIAESILSQLKIGVSNDLAVRKALSSSVSKLRISHGSRLTVEQDILRCLHVTSASDTDEWLRLRLVQIAQELESQSARYLKRDTSEEAVRNLVQVSLKVDGSTSHREAHEGAGQTDIVFRHPYADHDDVIELKVPRNDVEFKDGLSETAQYATSAHLDHAFYFVVDHCDELTRPRFLMSRCEHRTEADIAIYCVRVLVSALPPSKVGRARRINQ